MILSHTHRFLFIKTNKTASTSTEVFLSGHCGPEDIVTPIVPHVEPHVARNHEGYFNHIPAVDVRAKVDADTWRNYFKFCVERNPWDKVISSYYMHKAFHPEWVMSLDDFLASPILPYNHPLYTEPGQPQRVIVDRVLYYENLLTQLGSVFQSLGIPFAGSLGAMAKSEYRLDRRPYQAVYTPEQAERIARLFAVEIALHGYDYGTGQPCATRPAIQSRQSATTGGCEPSLNAPTSAMQICIQREP